MEASARIALLVIDVQKGLFRKSTPIYHAEQLLNNINEVIGKARQVRVPVIFIQHSNEKTLVRHSDDWRLHPEIQPLDDEIIIHKRSGDAFIGTDLQMELEKRNINTLFLTGLVTHGCVKATCLGALQKGYRVILVSDAHSSYSKDAPLLIEKWNLELSKNGAELLVTKDVDFA